LAYGRGAAWATWDAGGILGSYASGESSLAQGRGVDWVQCRIFSFASKRKETTTREPDWTELRDRWEYSHVIRAGFAFVSFVAILVALLLSAQS
jgi:hypothetical protein